MSTQVLYCTVHCYCTVRLIHDTVQCTPTRTVHMHYNLFNNCCCTVQYCTVAVEACNTIQKCTILCCDVLRGTVYKPVLYTVKRSTVSHDSIGRTELMTLMMRTSQQCRTAIGFVMTSVSAVPDSWASCVAPAESKHSTHYCTTWFLHAISTSCSATVRWLL